MSKKGLIVFFLMLNRGFKAMRGGELPVDALPQALNFTIRNGDVIL